MILRIATGRLPTLRAARSLLAIATGAAPTRAKPRHLEHEMQSALITRLDSDPRTRDALIYAVPNAGGYSGGFRSNLMRVMRMKAEGVRQGPPDLNIDEARGGYHGLRIELKAGKNKATVEQRAWHDRLRLRGYSVAICTTQDAAFAVAVAYLALPVTS